MGKKTIAEFVENVQTLEALREIGVDYGQGYGLARPAPFGAAVWPQTDAKPLGADDSVARSAL